MEYNLNKSLLTLERTSVVLKALLSGLPKDWTHENEGEDSWSPYDVIGHLIHGEETDWMPRTKIILGNGADKNFEPFDRFAQIEKSKGKSLAQLLEEFEMLRKKNLADLKALNLNEMDLSQQGIHPQFGAVSLKEMLAAWTAHDLGHIMQITRVMAKQYKTEVGPWEEYLGVLKA